MSDKWKFDSDDDSNHFNKERKIETRQRSLSVDNNKQNFNNSIQQKEKNGNREPCDCIGVFGLSKITTEKNLHDIFEQYGRIVSVKLIMDKNKDESLGFAFVKYENLECASKAIEMANEMNVDGRTLRVDYSITRKAHTPTPGQYKGKISNRNNYLSDNNKHNNYRRNSLEKRREFRHSDRENQYNSRNNRFDERSDRNNEFSKRNDYSDRSNNRFNERDQRNGERNHRFEERERYNNERSSRYDEKERGFAYRSNNDNNDRDYNERYLERDNRSDHLKRKSRVDSFDQNKYEEKRNFPHGNEKIYYSDRQRFSTNQRSRDCSREFRSGERYPRLNERNDRFREHNNQELNYSNERFRDRGERFENRPERRRSRSPVRRESPIKKGYDNFRSRKFI